MTKWTGGGPDAIGDNVILIATLEGIMRASPGDWIIKGVNSEFYPRKPDVFAKTYEREEDATANGSPLTARDAVGIARQAVADGILALAETYEDGVHADGYARSVLKELASAIHDGTLGTLLISRVTS